MPDAPSLDTLDDAACQRALVILLDVGTSLAQELKAPSADLTLAARTKAFEGVSLAVRRTIILSRHIASAPVEPVCSDTQRVGQRKHVIRTVEEAIDAKATSADAPALRVELLERVDSLDFDADLSNRSPGELVKELCRDLGLCNIPGIAHYPRRTPEDIALLCLQAAAPAGSGLPQWSAAATAAAQQNPPIPRDFNREERRQL